ncbi:MAG TPA: acetate kinase [Gemmataceae bacterium]|nr:acetate kinase [Gemmataceae bacterium]
MSILVVNAGSSSLKFGLFDDAAQQELANGLIDWTADAGQAELVLRAAGHERRSRADTSNHREAAAHAIRMLTEEPSLIGTIHAVGHRVVHGGTVFRESVRLDAGVREQIDKLSELAPLHNPPALEGIDATAAALPGRPQFAVFDTAFFADLTPAAYIYPIPYAWFADWQIRRFGFHGISHAYCAGRAAELLQRPATELRLVICHLGNGCSASAVSGGKAVDTTMGFTPMEGLMMGTRSGSIDPGILTYVERRHGLSATQVDDVLNRGSGLLGVSGVASDYRQVEAAAQAQHERARLALDIYARRVRATIGALAVTLGGMDALIFTAGVGEHSASLRAAACAGLECLGLELDAQRNRDCQPDMDIAASASRTRILVLHTREELKIAQEVRRLLGKD